MANRIGKYKLSKKEAELSLADGGEVKGDVKIMGKLNKKTSETIFKWDYISCPAPIISNFGSSAHGVLANGDQFGVLFPDSGWIFCCNRY